MAYLFADGFDHYATADETLVWLNSDTFFGGLVVEAGGRSGNRGAAYSENAFFGIDFASSHASGVFGAAVQFGALTANRGFMWAIEAFVTNHLLLQLDASAHIQIVRGDGTVLATGTTVLTTGVWYYIEFKFTIDNTTGSAEVRLNGSASAECSVSGADTRNGGSATWNHFRLRGMQGPTGTFFDDAYALDGVDSTGTHGLANNDFLGDCRVSTLLPETDAVAAGNYAEWTPSTGTDHGALVDEATPNGDTDYVSSATVDQRDVYQFPDLDVVPAAIYAVEVRCSAKKTTADPRSIAALLRSDGTDDLGATQALTTSYTYYREAWESDPDTGAPWTPTAVNSVHAGAQVIV